LDQILHSAQYFNGRSSAPIAATARLRSGGLLVSLAGGEESLWLFSDLRLTHGQPARLQRHSEVLVFDDPAFATHLAQANPESFGQMRGQVAAFAWSWVVISIAGTLATLALVWFFLIPRSAAALSSFVPLEWEERLGRSVADGYIETNGECKDSRVISAVEDIVDRLDRAKRSPYHFRVRVARSSEVNAFAAPGGYIVLFQGLLDKSDSPDEVAGVLAHEMEHVRQRHVTRGLLRGLTTSAILGIVMGDASAIASIIQSMGSLRFQREDEAAADHEGLLNLAKADIDPQGMIGFFKKLAEENSSLPALATYLSTHPDPMDRMERLKAEARHLRVHPKPFASQGDWKAIKAACAAR
jgi:beta-barrel assembly-enhancing protease